MFDVYSRCIEHVRSVAFTDSETLPTWPDMVRRNGLNDLETHLYKVYSESPIFLFFSGSRRRFLRWQSHLWLRPVKRIRVPRDYLPLKHHSPVHR